jgi:hypothetical protein
VGRWISQTSEKIKAECFSTLISSGGIEVVGFRSTRVVDLTSLKFAISEFGKWRKLWLGVESHEFPIREVLKELGRLIIGRSESLICGKGYS